MCRACVAACNLAQSAPIELMRHVACMASRVDNGDFKRREISDIITPTVRGLLLILFVQ
jgi:hypothetical protein